MGFSGFRWKRFRLHYHRVPGNPLTCIIRLCQNVRVCAKQLKAGSACAQTLALSGVLEGCEWGWSCIPNKTSGGHLLRD